MSKVTPRTPSGFNEYLPEEQLLFNRLMDIVRETYERYGFTPIDTPDIELSEVLLAKGGGETEQQVYRFVRGSNDLSLRFDLTVPLARYAAQHQGVLAFPFRRYHIGKVHRAERAQAGRFREFYQCDIDVIGSNSPLIDAEFPAIINEVFTQFDFGEFTIKINDRRILNGFFEGLGLLDQSPAILRVIDKMDKISEDALLEEFKSLGLTPDQIKAILEFVAITGDPETVLSALRELDNDSEQLKLGIESLTTLVAALVMMGVPKSRYTIDLKIARGLDYYTGTVYETVLDDYPEVGSVCSGGRYDDLAEYYTDTELPGVGISIGLTRLFYKLREAGIIETGPKTPAKVMVAPLNREQHAFALQVSAALRNAGIATELYTEDNAMKKKIRYANRVGFPYFVVIGEQEAADAVVNIKNMETGDSVVCDLNEMLRLLS